MKNQNLFLDNLYDVISDSKNNDLIAWTADGSGVLIKDMDKFEEIIIAQYFNGIKMNSFIRQLNLYSFRFTKNVGQNGRIYKQPNFVRGRRELLDNIEHKNKTKRRELKQRAKHLIVSIKLEKKDVSFEPPTKRIKESPHFENGDRN